MATGVGLDDIVMFVMLAVFVVRLSMHERRRRAGLSTDERIEVITEKVRNPVRYRVATMSRWIMG